MALRSNSLPIDGPFPTATGGPNLSLVSDIPEVKDAGLAIENGSIKIEHEDGSVTIDFDPIEDLDDGESDNFTRNLAVKMGDADLSQISSDLLEGIDRDELSRQDWLNTRAQGIDLLGLKIEKPRADNVSGSAPVEGMSTVRHPILLEATISFQATARAELLPASGPVKVRNDGPPAPDLEIQDTSARAELIESIQRKDELAQALEVDMNHYLTSTATEYVPDTDRMLFYIGFGGDGFKKVYNCPLRGRPVSESIDAKDLIISNAATDLNSCGRVTHRIMMRKSVLKRMQILGVYRDVDLVQPQAKTINPVDQKIEEISGYRDIDRRPDDRDFEVLEVYCELDLDEFAPKKFKGKGLPLPYRVTIERESRQILDIRRNWSEDDEECMPKRYFVQFPFVRGLGFYGLGFIHILGNTANTLTAAWRLILDNGMFANFPGFLYAKGAGRQNTNQFRVAPGQGVGLDVGAQQSIKDTVMPLPYKETGPSFTAFITHVEEVGRRLAASGNIQVGEGKQDAPVGTTLALIEQATKVIDSAHKRLHAAQAEEFGLLKERFREDPEAFWRHNKNPTIKWKKEQFIKALKENDLIPVADPNNPTSLHRIAKAMALKELQKGNPNLYDPVAIDMRIMRIVGIDPQGLFRPTPAPAAPDPRLIAIEQKAEQQKNAGRIALLQAQIKAATAYASMEDKEKERQSRERVAQWEREIEMIQLQQAEAIHANDVERDRTQLAIQQSKASAERLETLQRGFTEAQIREAEAASDAAIKIAQKERELVLRGIESEDERRRADERHQMEMERKQRDHEQKLENDKALAAAKVEAAKAMAKAKPKPTPKPKAKDKS
jgi:hypothetical protein